MKAVESNHHQFVLELKGLAGFVDEERGRAMRYLAAGILRSLVAMAPVDTGRFRHNWQVSTDHPGADEVPFAPMGQRAGQGGRHGWSEKRMRRAGQAQAQAVIDRGMKVIGAVTPGQSVNLFNNVPYATALEDGHSQQAPHGTVRVTLAAADQMMRGFPERKAG